MLRALSGPLAGATFEVGSRVLIGRVAACDVHLADIEVSREHAMIVTHDGKPTLVDLDSCNGTFVDGKRVRRVPLQVGETFSIADSKFIYDRAAPISTTPVLSAHFGVESSAPPRVGDDEGAPPTRETASVGSKPQPEKAGLDSSEERETQRSMAAVQAPREPVAVPRATVRLEAATAREPREKDTVQIRAAAAPAPSEMDLASRATASLAAVSPAPEAGPPEPPPSFEPPPVPPKPVAKPAPPQRGNTVTGAYAGDLFADVTAYRSFRLQLQRGAMPSGEEVSAMIDLEAELREPVETDPRRDVVTKRFFRRFPFVASLQARFSTSGRTVNAPGRTSNLSADGLQCSLDLGSFLPKSEQLAMLVIEHTRNGVEVRYSVTARVVWSQNRVAGFVFAGVPSWSERRSEFDDVDTAVRARPTF